MKLQKEKPKTQKTKRITGVNWGAERPRWASSPQHVVLGCMPGVVEEPSPTAESSLKLTSSFFAATMAAWAGGGCSVEWEQEGPGSPGAWWLGWSCSPPIVIGG